MTFPEMVAELKELAADHGKYDEKPESGLGDDDGMDSLESEELRELRAEKRARVLCESEHFTPTRTQLLARAGMKSDSSRRAMIHEFRRTARR